MCVVNKQFELLKFVFYSVYVALQRDKNYFTSMSEYVSWWCVYGHVVVFSLPVRLSFYPMSVADVTVMRVLLFFCMLR